MIKVSLPFIFVIMSAGINAQVIATLEVDLSAANGLAVPMNLSLKGITSVKDENLSLVKISGTKKTAVPFQVTPGEERILTWTATGAAKQTFQLVKGTPALAAPVMLLNKEGSYIISAANKNLLSYVHKKMHPPAGIDSAYGRSGFIHPLRTPHGQELTRIQPKDHYHHYGIWNPWTHVLFEGDTVDFWNIGGKKATVRYAKTLAQMSGNVFAELKVLHEHVVLKGGSEKIALNEKQTIRVYQPEEEGNYYIMDFTSELSCATASPFHIVAYRYGGFGWRATEFWDKSNSEMLTSEGRTRDNTDGTKGRWLMVYGDLPGNDPGGAVMLSHPDNYNHPEPLRIWDKKANGGRGDVFANFAPTKDKDWILEPGKTYTLRYRMVVFNGKIDAAQAESAWQFFAKPANVTVKK